LDFNLSQLDLGHGGYDGRPWWSFICLNGITFCSAGIANQSRRSSYFQQPMHNAFMTAKSQIAARLWLVLIVETLLSFISRIYPLAHSFLSLYSLHQNVYKYFHEPFLEIHKYEPCLYHSQLENVKLYVSNYLVVSRTMASSALE